MISVDELVEILNRGMTREFLEAALELYDEDDAPIDPEHPDMEAVLGKMTEEINYIGDTLPIEDEYNR